MLSPATMTSSSACSRVASMTECTMPVPVSVSTTE